MKIIAIVLFLILSVTRVCYAHPSSFNRVLTAHYNDPSTNCHVHEYEGGRGSWNIANGKVAGIWEFGDMDIPQTLLSEGNDKRKSTDNTLMKTDDTGEIDGSPQYQTHTLANVGTLEIDGSPQHQTHTPANVGTLGSSDEPTTPKQTVRAPADCYKLKGNYAIEFNDKDQIRIVAPEPVSAKLYLWFDDQETTIFGVLIGYVSRVSLPLEVYNTWIDIDTLQIVDHRQAEAKCYLCANVDFSDAIRMVLKVRYNGYLCPVAEYPEPTPAAPRLIKPKLATIWATLKK